MQDGFGFLHRTQNIAASQRRAGSTMRVRHEMPALVARQRGHRDATRHTIAALLPDSLQRSLHAVEDGAQQARPEFHRKRPAESIRDFARTQTGGVFVKLRQCGIAVTADHFADQPQTPYPNLLAQHRFRQLQLDQGAVDFKNFAHCVSLKAL